MPVTSFVLGRLINLLNGGVFGPYMDSLMKAALFSSFLRIPSLWWIHNSSSELDAQKDLCYSDITVVTHEASQLEKMYLKLKVSKADPFRQGCTIVLFTTATDTCPVHNMVHFLTKRSISLISPSEPLFLTADRKPLTRTVFVDSLRVLLLRLGFQSTTLRGPLLSDRGRYVCCCLQASPITWSRHWVVGRVIAISAIYAHLNLFWETPSAT